MKAVVFYESADDLAEKAPPARRAAPGPLADDGLLADAFLEPHERGIHAVCRGARTGGLMRSAGRRCCNGRAGRFGR
jgi:hypothetical protein